MNGQALHPPEAGEDGDVDLTPQELDKMRVLLGQFFRYHNLEQTAAVFNDEVEAVGLCSGGSAAGAGAAGGGGMRRSTSASFSLRNSRTRIMKRMLRAFDDGNAEVFWSEWNRSILSQDVPHAEDLSRVEFHVRVYFALYNLLRAPERDGSGGDATGAGARAHLAEFRSDELMNRQHHAMQEFRAFIESKAGSVSDPSVIPFFALPFVPDPSTHPSFAPQFEPDWAVGVRESLESVLFVVLDAFSAPTLHRMFRAWEEHIGHASGLGHPLKTKQRAGMTKSFTTNSLLRVSGEDPQQAVAVSRLLDSSDALVSHLEHLQAQGNFPIDPAILARMREQIAALGPHRGKQRRSPGRGGGSPSVKKSRSPQRSQPQQQQQQQQQRRKKPPPPSHPPPPHVVEKQRVKAPALEQSTPPQHVYRDNSVGADSRSSIAPPSADPAAFGDSQGASSPFQSSMESWSVMVDPSLDTKTLPLNYSKIKNDVAALPNINKVVLLQALRWRLHRSVGQQRLRVLYEYVENDVLELLDDDEEVDTPDGNGRSSSRISQGRLRLPGAMFTALLMSKDELVRQSVSRLINTISTYGTGRTYLLQYDPMIDVLLGALHREEGDTSVRQNLLGTLQQFSLRRRAQTHMIEYGVMDWLMTILRDTDSLSQYTSEYASALLMNLSLRTAGKFRVEQSAVDYLATLINMLEHPNPEVRTYVNGTIYSVLSRPGVCRKANQMGMFEILDQLMRRSDEQFRRQLEYILDRLTYEPERSDRSGQDDTTSAGEGEDDFEDVNADDDADSDVDEILNEQDDDELLNVPVKRQIIRGEQLLCDEYLDRNAIPQSTMENLRRSIALQRRRRTSVDFQNQRPMTPRLRSRVVQPDGRSHLQYRARKHGVQHQMQQPRPSPRQQEEQQSQQQQQQRQQQQQQQQQQERWRRREQDRDAAPRHNIPPPSKLPADDASIDEYYEAFESRSKLSYSPPPGQRRS